MAPLIASITLVALLLRAVDLGGPGVWFDEAYHVALIREPSVGAMIDAILANPPSAPAYALVLRGWVAIAGESDAAIRVPSVVAGTLLVPATAWLAAELDGRRVVAIGSAAGVAVSPYAVEFAREAAPYALAALATTGAIAATAAWLRTGRPAAGAGAVALGAAGAYLHYVAGGVVLLCLVLFAVWPGGLGARGDRRLIALAAGSIVAAWSPWLVALGAYWVTARAPRASLQSPATLEQVVGALAQYGAGTAALLEGVRPLLIAALVGGGLLVALGWWAGRSAERRGLRVTLVAAALLFAGPAVASAATGAWLFIPHFGLFTLPAVTVAAMAGIAEVVTLRPVRRTAVAAGAGLAVAWAAIAVAGSVLFHAAPPHGADGLRDVVARIERDAAGQLVLVEPAVLVPTIARYTPRPLVAIPRPFDLRDIYGPYARPLPDEDLRRAARAALGDEQTAWLVTRDELRTSRVVREELERTHAVTARFSVEYGTLLRLERRIDAASP